MGHNIFFICVLTMKCLSLSTLFWRTLAIIDYNADEESHLKCSLLQFSLYL